MWAVNEQLHIITKFWIFNPYTHSLKERTADFLELLKNDGQL